MPGVGMKMPIGDNKIRLVCFDLRQQRPHTIERITGERLPNGFCAVDHRKKLAHGVGN